MAVEFRAVMRIVMSSPVPPTMVSGKVVEVFPAGTVMTAGTVMSDELLATRNGLPAAGAVVDASRVADTVALRPPEPGLIVKDLTLGDWIMNLFVTLSP